MLLGVGASDDFLAKKTVAGNLSASQGGYPRGRTEFLLLLGSAWSCLLALQPPGQLLGTHRDILVPWCLAAWAVAQW